MKKRSGFTVMMRLIGLVKPLAGFMVLAITMGLIGHLCAAFITIFGGYAVADLLGIQVPFKLIVLFVAVCLFALVRGVLRYAEQACNHFMSVYRQLSLDSGCDRTWSIYYRGRDCSDTDIKIQW